METATSAFWQSTFEQHGGAVMAFLASRLGRRDLAEDLLQDTFVRVMRTEVPLREPEKVRSYLLSTAHRLVLNSRRRRRPLLFSELGSGEEEGAENLLPFSAPDATGVEELADLRALQSRLEDVLGELPPPQRRAFERVVLGQMSYADLATAEGWTVDQVRMNVYRGRKGVIARLRELLRVEEEEGEA
jgi:RNA polymerase sigma-70 factor (ECF subfamily)